MFMQDYSCIITRLSTTLSCMRLTSFNTLNRSNRGLCRHWLDWGCVLVSGLNTVPVMRLWSLVLLVSRIRGLIWVSWDSSGPLVSLNSSGRATPFASCSGPSFSPLRSEIDLWLYLDSLDNIVNSSRQSVVCKITVFCPQALPYVCLLIAMLFFIYAIIGMQVRSSESFKRLINVTLHATFPSEISSPQLLQSSHLTFTALTW